MAQNFKAETVGYLDQLITLGEETNKNYDEIYTALQLLVTSIEYEHDINGKELVLQIAGEFVYSEHFTLDQEETEENKRRILESRQ